MATFHTCRVHDIKKMNISNFYGIFGVRFAKFNIDGFVLDSRLSPPKELLLECKRLEKEGKWSQEMFDSYYTPNFLRHLKNEQTYFALKEIMDELDSGVDVLFVCYCKNPLICHRSLVAKILESYGYNICIH